MRSEAKPALELGIKSDPILYRYTWGWLFGLMRELEVEFLQLGSFFELYDLDDSWFRDLRRSAERYHIRIASCFTAHRELGGLLSPDLRVREVAQRNYTRFIEIAAILGASYCGSNPGSIPRDQLEDKPVAIGRYQEAMRDLSRVAFRNGLRALTVEPMSSLAEPPTTAAEIHAMGDFFRRFHREHPDDTVPVYFCGDVSHGYADHDGEVVESNLELFEAQIPFMCEFHYKNTDNRFNSTFGFGGEDGERGIVDPGEVVGLLLASRDRWPVDQIVGYLELPGPKLGRDYTDNLLGEQLSQSVNTLRRAMVDQCSNV